MDAEARADLVRRLAAADTLAELPAVIDLAASLPANPPQQVQTQFVGSSYAAAFEQARTFVDVVADWSDKYGQGGLVSADRVVDFGSGWGRITRLLLSRFPARSLYALDVDQEMTALVNTTLPGINAITVDPMPPTVLADASIDMAVAFSVFSHLAPHAHDAWAAEFGRIVAPGGMVFITVLDKGFLRQVAQAKKRVAKGPAEPFDDQLAALFEDIAATRAEFTHGTPVYAGVGGGGVRSGDFYGWAAIPEQHVRTVWGNEGFDIVEWVPSGVLFEQAMVGMRRRPDGAAQAARHSTRMQPKRNLQVAQAVSRKARRRIRHRLDRLLPKPLQRNPSPTK